MPELPEVEIIVRGLAPRLRGRRIERVEATRSRVAAPGVAEAAGYRIEGLRRWGKYIDADLEREGSRAHLVVHLGMTGQLVWNGEPGKHTRVVIGLDGGDELLYNDIRQFGHVRFAPRLPARLAELGPEPLEITAPDFARRWRARRAMAKALLLDQTFLRGLGNIYADEALFRARIHPRAIAARLKPQRAAALHRAIQRVLREAIRRGGSSIANYISSDGLPGEFQQRHRVYGRTGLPCRVCGTLIRRLVIASRGTHFCPKCQRR